MTILGDRSSLESLCFNSDHMAVVMRCKMSSEAVKTHPKMIFDWKNANTELFSDTLDQMISEVQFDPNHNYSTDEIGKRVDIMNTAFNIAMDASVKSHRKNPKYEDNITNDTLKLITELRTLRNDHYYYRRRNIFGAFTIVIQDLSQRIRRLNKIVHDRVIIDRSAAFAEKFSRIRPGPSMFLDLKKISTYKKFEPIPDMMEIDGRKVTSRQIQAKAFRNTFLEIHNQAAARLDPVVYDTISNQMNLLYGHHNPAIQLGNVEFPDQTEITTDLVEVNGIIMNLNGKCSSGFDRVPNRLLKKVGPEFRQFIVGLINNCSNTGFTPRQWKFWLVSPIRKPGKDPSLPTSYRPISLLSNISKLWERILLRKLEQIADEHNLIPQNQFGFVRGISTSHALTLLGSRIAAQLNSRKTMLLTPLDLNKAYESVAPAILIRKLTNMGVPFNLCRCIYDFLQERNFAVRLDGTVSDVAVATVGLPQGATLAPLLFKLFVADIPQPTHPSVTTISYADDLIVLATGNPKVANKRTNKYLEKLSEYYRDNGLKCNPDKSKVLMITGFLNRLNMQKRTEAKGIQVTMDGVEIPNCDSLKYLGIVFNKKFTFADHISNSVRKINGIIGAMHGLLGNRKLLSSRVKINFYKAAVRPCLAYGFHAWGSISSHQMETLRRAERRFIRWSRDDRGRQPGSFQYLNSTKIYQEANIKRIDAWMVSGYLKQSLKMANDENGLIRTCFQTEIMANEKYPPSERLHQLNEAEPLFNARNELLYFNRRIRDGAVLYTTAQ